jgi:hypothetical protein
VAQRVGRGIALLFHDLGTRMGLVVSSTPRPYFTPGKDPVPIVQEAVWAPGLVWTGEENLAPTGIRSPDRPGRSQSLQRLIYPVHLIFMYMSVFVSESCMSNKHSMCAYKQIITTVRMAVTSSSNRTVLTGTALEIALSHLKPHASVSSCHI